MGLSTPPPSSPIYVGAGLWVLGHRQDNGASLSPSLHPFLSPFHEPPSLHSSSTTAVPPPSLTHSPPSNPQSSLPHSLHSSSLTPWPSLSLSHPSLLHSHVNFSLLPMTLPFLSLLHDPPSLSWPSLSCSFFPLNHDPPSLMALPPSHDPPSLPPYYYVPLKHTPLLVDTPFFLLHRVPD